jgi:hypothetical protein
VQLSQHTVPIGTDDNRKEYTMRNASLALAFLLAASGVFAQQAPAAAVRTESATSPFTYEALGATPSIRLPRLTQAPAADKAAPNAEAQAAQPAQAGRTANSKTAAAPAKAVAPAATSTH